MTRTMRQRLLAASVASLVALSATACSGDEETDEPDAGPSLSDPSAAPTLDLEPVVRRGQVVGRLKPSDRSHVVDGVSQVAVRYLEDAFLTGSYPREGRFRASFAGFTPGAARAARADLGMLTNVSIAPRVDAVSPARLGVVVDVLAVGERATAATAHVRLAFDTSGKVRKHVEVQGRLMMTRSDGRWRVFGYDLTKGAR